jgi:hypothetical protein
VTRPIDLGLCWGYELGGDAARTALALPGAMLGGMPALAFAFEPLLAAGWRIVYVWDQFLDRAQDPVAWASSRAEAAAGFAGDVHLLVAKSLSTYAAGVAADRGWPAVWLTPLFDERTLPHLRRRSAPALFVGGTADPAWDGAAARGLSEDVLELDGADHGLARTRDAQTIASGVARFLESLDARAGGTSRERP